MTDIDKFMANQDRLQGMMIEAYQGQKIPNWYVFKPYFDWKMGRRGCTLRGARYGKCGIRLRTS